MADANWEKWLDLGSWRVWECCQLLYGNEPDPRYDFEPTRDDFLQLDPPEYLQTLYDRITRDIEAGGLVPCAPNASEPWKSGIRPLDLALWARNRDVYMDPALVECLAATLEDQATPTGPQEKQSEREKAVPTVVGKLKPMNYVQLAETFTCPTKARTKWTANTESAWEKLCRDAKCKEGGKTWGLYLAVVTKGKPGNPSTFDPEKVAIWLIDDRRMSETAVALELLKAIPEGPEFNPMRDRWKARASEGE